jgi:type IV secretion system protein VirB8
MMNAHDKDLPVAADRTAYYREAATWSADIHGALRASRRVAWFIAAAAAGVAVLEALALAALAPLKTVVPYTITVDRQTGYVEMAQGLKPGGLTQDQAITQSFLVQYVIARETFDATDLREAYKKVLLWSAGEARESYQHLMTKTTPASPLNLYAPTTVVSVTVKSVSLLSPTTALVRFDTTRTDAGSPNGSVQSFAAVMAFRYGNAPMTMGDRFINPLGFQVTRYRRDAETVAPAAGAPPAPAAPLAQAPPAQALPAQAATAAAPTAARAVQTFTQAPAPAFFSPPPAPPAAMPAATVPAQPADPVPPLLAPPPGRRPQ